jgi:hypothetical protein
LKEYGMEMKNKDPKKYNEINEDLKKLERTITSFSD